uniref:hypothetical protein n=1 Tax=Thaumasiovibrio occultus TaxID=1891184 RepID=UPI00131DE118|nr:hypothetical protein [Thaumasiovibrio occultus]
MKTTVGKAGSPKAWVRSGLMVKTWMIVALGLAMNVAAALMTHLLIEKRVQKMGALANQQMESQQLIEQTWQHIETLERKKEWLILLPPEQLGSDKTALVLAPWVAPSVEMETLALLHALDARQDQLRRSIDDHYLDILDLNEAKNQQAQDIAAYRNLALFLQIMGLALILARDLRRR